MLRDTCAPRSRLDRPKSERQSADEDYTEHKNQGQHIGREDLACRPARVVGDRAGVDDGVASCRCPLHRHLVAEIVAGGEVERPDKVPFGGESSRHRLSNLAGRARQEHCSHPVILAVGSVTGQSLGAVRSGSPPTGVRR